MAKAWYLLTSNTDPFTDSNYNYSNTAIGTLCPSSNNYICAVYADYTTGQAHPVLTTNLNIYITTATTGVATPSPQPAYLRKRTLI